jgi:hypothetical protein
MRAMSKALLALLVATLASGAVLVFAPPGDESSVPSAAAVSPTAPATVELMGRCEGPGHAADPRCRRPRAREHKPDESSRSNGLVGDDHVSQSNASPAPAPVDDDVGADRGDRGPRQRGDRESGPKRPKPGRGGDRGSNDDADSDDSRRSDSDDDSDDDDSDSRDDDEDDDDEEDDDDDDEEDDD